MSSTDHPLPPFETVHGGHWHRPAVTIELPSTLESLPTLSTLVTCLAADVGLDVEEIDDVRLALEEIVGTLIDQTDDDRVRVYFARLDDGLQVSVDIVSDADVIVSTSSLMILNALVDDLSFTHGIAIFTKRARRAAA